MKRVLAGLLAAVCVSAALLTGFALLTGQIGRWFRQKERERLLDSVRAAALSCYAMEGAYPSSLGYLRAHYGLAYDEVVYAVGYRLFAPNVPPDVFVTETGGGLR